MTGRSWRETAAARALAAHRWELAIFAVWAVLTVAGAFRHEMWRDEVRALSIAVQSPSPLAVLAGLKNDGHPALWHLLLWATYRPLGTPLVLPVLSWTMAAAAVLLLLRSPLARWQKALFVAGVLPLHEYSVMCRSYGLSMLLLFGMAAVLCARRSRPLWFGVLLFLLAQTNLPGIIVAIGVVGSLALVGMARSWKKERIRVVWVLAWVLGVAGVVLAVLQVAPDQHASLFHPERFTIPGVRDAALTTLSAPGAWFREVVPLPRLPASLLLWAAGACLLHHPVLLAVYGASLIGFGAAFQTVYPGFLRHQGVFLMLWVALWWVGEHWSRQQEPARLGLAIRRLGAVLFGVTLVLQIPAAVRHYRLDWEHPLSSAKAFGAWLQAHPELAGAVVMGEPDYLLESLPYYAPHAIYLPRNDVFSTTVSRSREADPELSLGAFLESAGRLEAERGTPVLLVLGRSLTAEPTHRATFGDGRTFTADAEQWRRFHERTVLVAEFASSLSDENYTVFRLR